MGLKTGYKGQLLYNFPKFAIPMGIVNASLVEEELEIDRFGVNVLKL